MRRTLALLSILVLPGCWLTSAEVQERLDADTAAEGDDDDDGASRRVDPCFATGDTGHTGQASPATSCD